MNTRDERYAAQAAAREARRKAREDAKNAGNSTGGGGTTTGGGGNNNKKDRGFFGDVGHGIGDVYKFVAYDLPREEIRLNRVSEEVYKSRSRQAKAEGRYYRDDGLRDAARDSSGLIQATEETRFGYQYARVNRQLDRELYGRNANSGRGGRNEGGEGIYADRAPENYASVEGRFARSGNGHVPQGYDRPSHVSGSYNRQGAPGMGGAVGTMGMSGAGDYAAAGVTSVAAQPLVLSLRELEKLTNQVGGAVDQLLTAQTSQDQATAAQALAAIANQYGGATRAIAIPNREGLGYKFTRNGGTDVVFPAGGSITIADFAAQALQNKPNLASLAASALVGQAAPQVQPTTVTPTQQQLDTAAQALVAIDNATPQTVEAAKKTYLDAVNALGSNRTIYLPQGARMTVNGKTVEMVAGKYSADAFTKEIIGDLGVKFDPAILSQTTGTSTGTQAPAAGTSPTTATAGSGELPEAPEAKGGQAKPARLNSKPTKGDLPQISVSRVKWLQEILTKAGQDLSYTKKDGSKSNGIDGLLGPLTVNALKEVAKQAGITDLKTLNFNDVNDPETKKFLDKARELAAPKAPPAPQGPSAEDIARQQAAAQAQAKADAEAKASAQAKAQAEAEERTRPRIVVDLPNDLDRGATIRHLVGLRSLRGDSGEQIEFHGPQGPHHKILDNYVRYVRDAMEARGMDPSRETGRETAAIILAAYNGIATTDEIGDLARLRMPNERDINASIDSMRTNVLIDGKIHRRELKLSGELLERAVFENQPVPSSVLQQAAAAGAGLTYVNGGQTVTETPGGAVVAGGAVQPGQRTPGE